MNVLIVYAHQEPKSFNDALKNVALETLTAQGHKVTISDLYDMRFDPTASKHQFKELSNTDHFDFQRESSHSANNNNLPEDIKAEIDKLVEADLIILVFPLYWLGMPAILKGWLDRCLVENVAFGTETNQWFDDGLFAKKKIVLCFTAGGSQGFFSNRGVFGDMDVILWPIQNALRMTGLQILDPQICYAPGQVGHDVRTKMLDDWKRRLENIGSESPLKFVHIRHFGPANDFQLTDDFVEKIKVTGKAPTPGQNLGLPLTPGSMTLTKDSTSDE